MANYIDKEIICESYIHLEFNDYNNTERVKEIEAKVKKYFDERLKHFLGTDIQSIVETEEGSLKLKITAFAGIIGLLGGSVLKYTDFRDNVKAIYSDSQALAQATAFETVFVSNVPSCEKIHSEARTGVIGRTAKLISAFEKLTSSAKYSTSPVNKDTLEDLKKLNKKINAYIDEMHNLLGKIKNDEDRFCIASGLHSTMQQFPKSLGAKDDLLKHPIKKTLLQSENILVETEIEIQNYENIIDSALKSLKNIGNNSKSKNT